MKRRARRRLVGAIALIVFVVIALPIVLDREPKQVSQDLTIQIPSQDSGKFSSRLATAPTEASPKSVSELSSPPVVAGSANGMPNTIRTEAKPEAQGDAAAKANAKPGASQPEPSPGKSIASAGTVAKPDSPAKKESPAVAVVAGNKAASDANARKDATKAPSPAVAAEGKPAQPVGAEQGFVVPLGVFTKADNVKQVRGKATAAGFKTFSEPVDGTDRVRVRAGPFPSRELAEQARDKLKGAGLTTGAVLAQ